jgi:hypothetical protein
MKSRARLTATALPVSPAQSHTTSADRRLNSSSTRRRRRRRVRHRDGWAVDGGVRTILVQRPELAGGVEADRVGGMSGLVAAAFRTEANVTVFLGQRTIASEAGTNTSYLNFVMLQLGTYARLFDAIEQGGVGSCSRAPLEQRGDAHPPCPPRPLRPWRSAWPGGRCAERCSYLPPLRARAVAGSRTKGGGGGGGGWGCIGAAGGDESRHAGAESCQWLLRAAFRRRIAGSRTYPSSMPGSPCATESLEVGDTTAVYRRAL